MKRRMIKEELKNGKPLLGFLMQYLITPEYIEFVRHGNPDWLLFDLEHTPENLKSMQSTLWACLAYNIPAIVRVQDKQEWMIEAALDCGFQGIVVPSVETAEEARMVVRAARYTRNGNRELGDRGWCMLTPPTRWLADYSYEKRWDANTNEESWNKNTFVGIILETPTAYENLDEILAVEGIDAIWPGPGDLSNRMGKRVFSPEVQEIVMNAEKKAAEAGKIVMAAATPQVIKNHYDVGARMFCLGECEMDFLPKLFSNMFGELRELLPK